VLTSRLYRAVKTLYFSYKNSQLMLYREISAVCSRIHTKHINTLRGQNAELLNDKPGGTQSEHCALSVQKLLAIFCPAFWSQDTNTRYSAAFSALRRAPCNRCFCRFPDWRILHQSHWVVPSPGHLQGKTVTLSCTTLANSHKDAFQLVGFLQLYQG
jgi:hypothetical protein